jgi:AcrR family transcriptional regulator
MPSAPAFRLAQDLLAQSASSALKKSERTRLRLLAAVAAQLDQTPFAQMRAEDVATRAELSKGLMYHYFRDLPDMVTQVVELFESRFYERFPPAPKTKADYDYPRTVSNLAWYLSCYLRNRGLFRVMFTQSDQLPGVKAVIDRLTLSLHEQLGEFIDAPPVLPFDSAVRLLAGHFVGGAMDDLVRQLFQLENANLPVPRTTQQLFDLVQLCSALRHRLMHGVDPDPGVMRDVAATFDLSVFDGCFPAAKAARLARARTTGTPKARADRLG